MPNLDNLLREQYLIALYEEQILESLKPNKLAILIEQFIDSISDDFDLFLDEDFSIDDLLEAFEEFDFDGNLIYDEILEIQTAAQKKAAKKRSKEMSKKAKGPAKDKGPKKAKLEPKAKSEKPKDEPSKEKSVKEKPESSDKKKSEGGDKKKLESLQQNLDKAKEQIANLKKQSESIDGEKDPAKKRDNDLSILKAQAEKSSLSAQKKKLEKDEKAPQAAELAKLSQAEASAYEQWVNAKKEEKSLGEAEEDDKAKVKEKVKTARIAYLQARLDRQKAQEKGAEGDAKTKWTDASKKTQDEIDSLKSTEGTEKPKAGTGTETEDEEDLDSEIEKKEDEIKLLQKDLDNESLELTKLKGKKEPEATPEELEKQGNKVRDAQTALKKGQGELKTIQGKKSKKEKSAADAKTKADEEKKEKDADAEYDKLQELNQKIEDKKEELKNTTDPKEKARIQGELDKLKFQKANSEKKIKSLTGMDGIGAESEDEDKDKKAQIEKLEAEIKKLEEDAEGKVKAIDDSIKAEMEKTNKLVGWNLMLRSLLSKIRLENSVKYNEAKIKLGTPDLVKELEDKNKATQKAIGDVDKSIQDTEKKTEEKNTDNPEVQDALKKSKEEEAESSKEEPTTDIGNKSDDTPAETSKTTTSEDPKERKKKEIGIKLDNLQKKLKGAKAAAEKAADSDNENAFDNIMKNVEELEKGIEDLKKEKENLGESFDEIDAKLWALEWMVEDVIHRINNQLYELND
jgi:hypothetical protein